MRKMKLKLKEKERIQSDPTTGVVTFKPLPTFKGEGKGVNVQVISNSN